MESLKSFEHVQEKLNQTLQVLSDESRRNYQNGVKTTQLTIAIWQKFANNLEFPEKGKLLILIIRVLHQISKIHQEQDGQNKVEFRKYYYELQQKIIEKFVSETLSTLNHEILQDSTTLEEFQELLVTLSSILTIDDLLVHHQLKTCMWISNAFNFSTILKSYENEWMEQFVYFLCTQIKLYTEELLKEQKNDKAFKVLRYYNRMLIGVAKAFPNKAFRGASHVLQLLLCVYKMMNAAHEKSHVIQTNTVVPLLGFLEYVQLNDGLSQTIFDFNQEPPSIIVPIITEIIKILSKNPSPDTLQQYFGDHLDENLFIILFEASIQLETVTPAVLSGLTACLSMALQLKKSFQSVTSRLITSLLSRNINNAYISLNIWTFIARVSSKEICHKMFNDFRQIFLMFPKFSNSVQKYFVGKTMNVFYLCLKSTIKRQVVEENGDNLMVMTEIGMRNITETRIVQDLYDQTQEKITGFLKNGRLYQEMIEHMSVCLTQSEVIPKKTFFDAVDDLFTFLFETSSTDPFLPLILVLLKFCTSHIKNIPPSTVTNVKSLFLKLDADMKCTKIIRCQFLQFVQKYKKTGLNHGQDLASTFKSLLNEIPSSDDTKIIFKAGYLSNNNENHVCRTPLDKETIGPLMKKQKLDTVSSDKEKASSSLRSFEKELEESGLLMSIPQLNTHLRAIKSLLS